MEVRVLGNVEAGNGRRTYLLGGPTQRRVFAALVARRREVVDISSLVDVCWPDAVPPDRAEHNIRTYVHRLRNALQADGERLETVGTGYRFDVGPAELDLDRFEELAAVARRAVSTADSVGALEAADAADEMWRGRPYGEFADEPWAVAEVARVAEAHATLAESRVEALLAAGRAVDAVALTERLVRDEPLRERPRALLMRALYESGRQAEALRAFQQFRRFLIDEAGVEPSTELVTLDRRIARGDLDASATSTMVGNYELHERIGEGAFAVVHRATQASLGREVAVKIVRAELANRREFIRRFEAEAQMVARIEHPNVVPLYDYWREPDRAYLVMRFMSGGSLEARLDDGRWSPEATVDLVDQIAGALDAAHRQGVIHRDVKPANILFDDDGRAYLGDFGIALGAEEQANPGAALSEGSPIYASPEHLRHEPVGPEADVHALAIVAYTLLAGHVPFADAPDETARLQRRLHDPIPDISSLRPDVPAGLDPVMQIATAKRPADRYPSASGFAVALRSAVERPDVAVASTAAPTVPAVNPYRGLRAFTEADAALFHGRSRLVDELVEHLDEAEQPLLVLVGPSGSGKSSVVRAGLVPALRGGRIAGSADWFTTTMIPGMHPYEALETALLRIATNPPAALLDQLRDGDRGMLRAIRRVLPDDDAVVAIIIDQFEELFTATGAGERDHFLRSLAVAVTEPGTPVRVVATLRADFYDQPLRHPDFAPLVKDHTIPITPLAPDELEAAIRAPAAAVGVDYEPGLIAEIIADVNSQPGALPLLQYALTRAYDAAGDHRISVEHYHAVGGLTGALSSRAEELFADAGADERWAARRLFGRLVTLGEGTEDTRRRVRRSELPDDLATTALIERFGAARLLTFDRDPSTREPTVEVAHESLLSEWPRLREWLDADRDSLRLHRHLTIAASAWADRDRDPNELYRGARLEAAEVLLDDDIVSLNEDEIAFLRAGIQRRDAERESERVRVQRLHRLVAAMAVVAAIALVAGAVALRQWNRADAQTANARASATEAAANAEAADRNAAEAAANADRADENADQAEANADRAEANAALAEERAVEAETAERQADLERLRAVARATAGENPAVAALLAVEAQQIDPSVDSLDVIQRVLTETPGYHGSIATVAYRNAELVGDDRLVADNGAVLDVWDLRNRVLLTSIGHPGAAATGLLTAVGSDRVAAVDAEGDSVAVYDVATGSTVSVIPLGAPVTSIEGSADGSRIAVAVAGGEVEIAAVEEAAIVDRIDAGDADVAFLRWHPTDDQLAVVTRVGTAQLWDLTGDRMIWSTGSDGGSLVLDNIPFAAAFDAGGDRFAYATGAALKQLRTVGTADGAELFPVASLPLTNTVLDGLGWVDEDRIIVPSRTGILSVDMSTGAADLVRDYGTIAVAATYSSAIDRWVVAGSTGVGFWSIDGSGPLVRDIALSTGQVSALRNGADPVSSALSSDGSRILVSVYAPSTAVTSVDLASDPPSTRVIDGVAYVAGYGEYTFVVSRLGAAQVVDADLEPLGPPVNLPPDLAVLGVSEDGRFLAIGRYGGLADVYRTNGDLLGTVQLGDPGELEGVGVAVSFTSDGDYLSLTATTGKSGVWRTDPLERLDLTGVITSPTPVYALGPWLFVTALDAGSLQQRVDPSTMRPIGPPISLNGLNSVGFPQLDRQHQRLLATGPAVVKVIDIESGRQLGRDLPARGGLNRIQLSGDGTILAVPRDRSIDVWNLDTDTWVEIACRFAGRNLTADEWAQFGPRTIEYRATCDQYPTGT